MREVFLIFHFLGLAMGLGTSIAMMFIGIASAKMPPEEARKIRGVGPILMKMGHTGFAILILSGGALMTPYWKSLGNTPLLVTKLILVLVLLALVGILSSYSKKMRITGDESYGAKMAILGRFSLLTALAIVTLAVLVFH